MLFEFEFEFIFTIRYFSLQFDFKKVNSIFYVQLRVNNAGRLRAPTRELVLNLQNLIFHF